MSDPAVEVTLRAEAVIQEYGPRLARVVASYERNRALREELLQEIFLAVVTALPRLKDRAKLRRSCFASRITARCGTS